MEWNILKFDLYDLKKEKGREEEGKNGKMEARGIKSTDYPKSTMCLLSSQST